MPINLKVQFPGNMSCGICLQKISRQDASLACKVCNSIYHGKCLNYSLEDVKNIDAEKKGWICKGCLTIRRQSSVFDTVPVMGLNTTLLDPETESEVTSNMLMLRINQLGSQLEAGFHGIGDLVKENFDLKKKVIELQSRLDKIEQQLLDTTIELVNVPLVKNENVVDVVSTVITTGLQHTSFDKSSIVKCHRESRSNRIVVKLSSTKAKDNILQKMRTKKSVPGQIIDALSVSKIFINESLTFYKRQLYREARTFRLNNKIKYLWTRNGQIMMRQIDGGKIFYINQSSDLQKLVPEPLNNKTNTYISKE